MVNTSWQTRGLCKGMGLDVFFLSPGKSPKKARAICQRCPVRKDCLKESIVYEERGIWAGMTEEERDAISPDVQEIWREQMRLAGVLKEFSRPSARSAISTDSIRPQCSEETQSDIYLSTLQPTDNQLQNDYDTAYIEPLETIDDFPYTE